MKKRSFRFPALAGLLAVLAASLLAACEAVAPLAANLPAEKLGVEVLDRVPKDTKAYTQGYLIHENMLYESTGLEGQSSLRLVDPKTGRVQKQVQVPPEFFAEGLALVDNTLIQLTWTEGVAFLYDAQTFSLLGTYRYEGEGWGLCYDGQQLYMSDGSDLIFIRDPETFRIRDIRKVRLNGQPVTMLNELECVGDSIYANVWMTDQIVRIDKATGRVTGDIDARGLLTPEEAKAAGTQGVLNGIAYDPVADNFLITGKLWPWKFTVRFVPRPDGVEPTPIAR